MKIVVQNYTFNAAAKTVTFTDYGSIAQKNIFLIVNSTTGDIIYNFADPAKGGTVATNVLTLEFDTTLMNNTDKLVIIFWDGNLTSIVDGLLVNLGANNDVAVSSSALPTGASTAANQTTANTSLSSIDTKVTGVSTAAKQDTGNTSLTSIDTKLTDNATQTTLATRLSESDFDAKTGSLTEAAPATDTASSGLNGRLQRIAQRISSLIALIPAALTGSGNFKAALVESTASVTVAQATAANLKVDASGAAVPVTDNAGSITVDAPVGTPAFVRLSDGAAAISTLPVSLASVPSHAVTNAGTFAVQSAGDVASGSADSGSPVKVGFQARTTSPTAVTDGQRANAISDKVGRQVVAVGQIRDLVIDQMTLITSSVAETTIGTQVASTFLDLVSIIITNSSATDVVVDIRDTTGGTIQFSIAVKAGTSAGAVFTRPVKQATVNTNWTATCSASVASVRVFAQFEKNT